MKKRKEDRLGNMGRARTLAEQIAQKLGTDSLCSLSDLKLFLEHYLTKVNEPENKSLLPSSVFSSKNENKDKSEINIVRSYALEIIKKLDPDDIWGLSSLKSVLEAELEKVESSISILP